MALTNTPFMEGMTPVASSARQPGELQRLIPTSSTLVINHKRPKEGAPSSTQTPTPAMSQTETGLRAFLNRAAKKLRMNSTEPDEVDVLMAAADAAERAAALDADLAASRARVAELEAEVQTLKTDAQARTDADAQAQAEVDQALLDAAVADYKIPEADRAAWGERLNSNREATAALINSIPAGTVRPNGAARVQPPKGGMVNSADRTTDRKQVRANARAALATSTK